MDAEQRKIEENNEIIDHLEAAQRLIAAKCARCGGRGCMGCLFDSFDRGTIPALFDRAASLMSHVPNERKDIVAQRQKQHHEREAKWSEIASKGNSE